MTLLNLKLHWDLKMSMWDKFQVVLLMLEKETFQISLRSQRKQSKSWDRRESLVCSQFRRNASIPCTMASISLQEILLALGRRSPLLFPLLNTWEIMDIWKLAMCKLSWLLLLGSLPFRLHQRLRGWCITVESLKCWLCTVVVGSKVSVNKPESLNMELIFSLEQQVEYLIISNEEI